MRMNLVLLGYRGSGKSTVGRLAADRLGMTFADVDELTVQRFGGMSIADIWKTHGEPAFRDRECEVVRELLGGRGQIIAFGGGTIMQPRARDLLMSAKDAGSARCVYLAADPAVLHRRIAADANSSATRPSLTALGGGLEEIEHVLAERGPAYRAAADAVVDVTSLDVEQAVQEVVRAAGAWSSTEG